MPTTRQRAKGQTLESFERELKAVRAEEEAHAQALRDFTRRREEARKRREALEEQKQQLQEEEALLKEHERRMHMSRRSESVEKFANRAWERMDDIGECTECTDHGVDCFRAAYDPKEPGGTNAQWFLIGDVHYSRCQECKARRRLCVLKNEEPEVIKVEDTPPPPTPAKGISLGAAPPSSSSKRKRRDGSTPAPEIGTSGQMEKTKSTSQNRKAHLPTPSSVTEFVQGSSSRPLAKDSRTRKSGSKRRRLKKLEAEVAGLHEKMADMSETQRQVLLLVTRLAGSGIGPVSQDTQGYESDELEYTDGE